MAKRSDILSHYKTRIAALAGMHAERVTVGAIDLMKLPMGKTVVGIRVPRDNGERQENITQRRMVVIVSAVLKVDPLKSIDELVQLSDDWDLVHAELEKIADDCAQGKALMIREDPEGVMFDDFDDKDHFAFAASVWAIEYRRARGGTE
jgi:hypothetical protein